MTQKYRQGDKDRRCILNGDLAVIRCFKPVDAAAFTYVLNQHALLLKSAEQQLSWDGHTFECMCSQTHDREMERTPSCINKCKAMQEAVAMELTP